MKNHFDFVVIGSGPAGSIISKFLSEQKYQIALIDRASDKYKGKKNFIFNPYVNNCPSHYTPSFSDQLGGNSALWHKKIYLISKEEVTNGKWSIKYSEIFKYSNILAKKLGIKHNELIYNNNKKKKLFKYSQSKRAEFSNIYNFLDLKNKQNIKTFKNSSPIKLFFKNKNRIKSVRILNMENRSVKTLVVKKGLIFCAGGLGNTFLLKNLTPGLDKKTGNFLCDHPHIQIVKLNSRLASSFKKISKVFLFHKNKKNTEKKRELNIYTNIKNYFAGIQLSTNIDPSLILSRIYLKTSFFNFFGYPIRFIGKIIKILIFFVNIFFKIYYKIFDIIGVNGKYSFEFFFSQQKNPKNNLKLNRDNKDLFGLNKIDINWSISKKDLNIYNRIINEFLNSSKKLKNKKFTLKKIDQQVYVGLHPSCSNSFGKDKKFLVDENLKIKKFSNLFICGSDVFPSNGFTNPTWTIMTLGTRLSYHLRKKFK